VAFAQRRSLAAAQREVAAARESYRLNEERIRRAPEQGRPIELLQAIQALAQARQDYLRVVSDYNRAQFRLYTALGNPPLCALTNAANVAISEATVPPKPATEDQAPPPRPVLPKFER
jgi:outer membrane protein TolC